MNFVQQIYDFNKQAGLLEKGYDDFLESSFQIEEALEGFPNLQNLANILTDEESEERVRDDASPKNISRAIVQYVRGNTKISDVDRLDKAIDAIVFAIGSIAKLGLSPAQITRAIDVVTEANLQKLSMPKDEHGKLMKPKGFVGPEAKLQSILDERIPII